MPESHPTLYYLTPMGPGAGCTFTDEDQAKQTGNQKVAGEASLDDLLDFLFGTIPQVQIRLDQWANSI